ncbi:alpha/beta fold hydrolase [Arthrobacter sp. B1805]|uniref:alpha/beta fold hydrolase n=1 Tax=Arthrobacter sp. B1805 TaxID=2058892 RepID=UPI0015E31282|nr:alpha/beta fold hydrolase [Arthrobacter sp. B1805]
MPTQTADAAAMIASTRTIEVDAARERFSCRIHLARRVPDPGQVRPLFVMVHGIGMSHRYYDKLQRKFIEHGDTLILDLPGFGGTPKPGHRMSVEDYAAVIARTLDDEGASGCVVIGHSMGAQFVTELAISRPDLVSRLVLIGPVTDVEHRSPMKHTLMLAADTLIERPVTNLMVGTAYAKCGIRWYLQELPVMLDYSLDDRLPLVDCPVLIIRGTRDIISGHDWCEKLSCHARNGNLVEITGQPHAAHRGGAAAISTAVLTTVEKQARKQAEESAADQSDEPADGRAGDRPLQGELLQEKHAHASFTRSARSYTPGPRSFPQVLELRSITVGDRQCRSYFIGHDTGPSREGRTDRVRPGNGTAAPVFVLIHGIGMSHRYFRRLGAVLAAYGDVHLIDLPGYGWTRRPEHASSNEATADLVGRLLDEAGASSCVVVGHSMGVQSATELAIERPDLVSHLVLIGAAIDVDHRTVPQQAVRLGVNSILEKPLLSMMQSFDVLRCGPRWYLAQLKLALSYPIEDRLPLVDQPVLVLRGSRDVVAGAAWSDRLARTARRGDAGTIDGAPHAAHHSAAGAVATAITDFLSRR